MNVLKYHECPDGTWERQYDSQGIYLCRTCPECHEAKMSGYRPEILTGYDQSDVDEPIEPDYPMEDDMYEMDY